MFQLLPRDIYPLLIRYLCSCQLKNLRKCLSLRNENTKFFSELAKRKIQKSFSNHLKYLLLNLNPKLENSSYFWIEDIKIFCEGFTNKEIIFCQERDKLRLLYREIIKRSDSDLIISYICLIESTSGLKMRIEFLEEFIDHPYFDHIHWRNIFNVNKYITRYKFLLPILTKRRARLDSKAKE